MQLITFKITLKLFFNKLFTYFSDPILILFYFKIRIFKKISKLYKFKIFDVSTLKMTQDGIFRYVQNGNLFFKYKDQIFPESIAKGNAVDNIRDKANKYCKGKGLDIGCKNFPLEGAIGIDNEEHLNAYKLDQFENESLDFIFSSHCLEHLADWKKALGLWITKIKKDGILFLYLPHESMSLWEPGSPWVGNDHKWQPNSEVILNFLKKNNFEIDDYIDGPDHYYSFFIIAKKK